MPPVTSLIARDRLALRRNQPCLSKYLQTWQLRRFAMDVRQPVHCQLRAES